MLRQSGCPVCRGLTEAMHRSIFWFLYEGYFEEGSIRQLCASGGFCPSHFWVLVGRSGTWTLSAVPQYLIQDVLERLQGARRSRWRRPSPIREDWPSCVQLAWWEQYLVGLFVIALRDPDVRSAYAQGNRLCPRHVRLVCTSQPDRRHRRARKHPEISAIPCSELQRESELVPRSMTMHQCPLCGVELTTRRTMLEQWQLDSDGSLSTHQAWEDLCALHEAWLIITGSPSSRGRGHDILATSGMQRALDQTRRHRSWRREAPQECPLCMLERQVTRREANRLLSHLALGDKRTAYAAGLGLCVRHFVPAVSEAPPDLQRFLVDQLQQQLVTLLSELSEFFRKADYRYRLEPRGAEQTAWRRAIVKLVGAPELALPGCGIPDGR
jgi:hypothetical protein